MPRPSEIDRLLEEGLARYGAGDLDGALKSWDRALALEPDNAQVNSYVAYVRTNYDVLAADSQEVTDGGGTPFGIEEEPEYQIEILDLAGGDASPMYMDPLDAGWFIDDAPHDHEAATVAEPRKSESEPEPEVMELEADEPPMFATEGISFDDSTTEYPGGPPRTASPDTAAGVATAEPATTEFHTDEPTGGFATAQPTDVRKRDLGFVKAAREPVELKMTLRTPVSVAPADNPSPQIRPDTATSGLGDGTATVKLAASSDIEDRISAAEPIQTSNTPTEDLPPRHGATLDLPTELRASADPSAAMPAPEAIATSREPTYDFSQVTADVPAIQQLELGEDPMISAPTRELGLRPNGRAATGLGEEDEVPTKQSDVRAIRDSAAGGAERQPLNEDSTQSTLVAFDPLDLGSDQILEEIDVGAPPNETKEDRTRRRIADLIGRAVTWSETNEIDKAVTAIDLALSEDPNSPLAQKLIHRNRDPIMTVLQTYLGDLERQPQLARPLHELAKAPISSRAAFLLSRIDGSLTLDEILDVSGMPRLEAFRLLSQLFLRGILR